MSIIDFVGELKMLNFVSAKEFINIIADCKEIICFGAGRNNRNLTKVFENDAILDKISCFVDNNEHLWGEEKIINGRSYKIVSVKQLKTIQLEKKIILITCANYDEIYEQIRNDDVLRNIECYWFEYMKALYYEEILMNKKIPSNIKIMDKPIIPKKIHYCWFGKNLIPDKNKKWMESWKKYCPDYEIIEWNESNYDIGKNLYMQQAYEKKKWGFVPDYARLDIIYHYGGIYLDTDVELVGNLDELLYQKGFAGFEKETHVALGLGFGAVKGLPIIKEMMEQYNSYKFINEDGSLNMIAAPELQTRYLKTKGLIANGEYQILNDLTIFPSKMFGGKDMYTRKINLASYTKSIHHYDASWVDEDARKEIDKMEKIFKELK